MSRWVFALSAFWVVACASHDEPEPKLIPAARQLTADDIRPAPDEDRPISTPETLALSRERCDREQRCGRIGADQRYKSRVDCLRSLNELDFDAYGPSVCATGVDPTRARPCHEAIQSYDCASPDTLENIEACHPSKLCRD